MDGEDDRGVVERGRDQIFGGGGLLNHFAFELHVLSHASALPLFPHAGGHTVTRKCAQVREVFER